MQYDVSCTADYARSAEKSAARSQGGGILCIKAGKICIHIRGKSDKMAVQFAAWVKR